MRSVELDGRRGLSIDVVLKDGVVRVARPVNIGTDKTLTVKEHHGSQIACASLKQKQNRERAQSALIRGDLRPEMVHDASRIRT